jgi:hypothetical protein
MASGRWAQWVKAFPFTTLRGPQVGEFFSQADFATLPHVNALCTARKTFLIFFFFSLAFSRGLLESVHSSPQGWCEEELCKPFLSLSLVSSRF